MATLIQLTARFAIPLALTKSQTRPYSPVRILGAIRVGVGDEPVQRALDPLRALRARAAKPRSGEGLAKLALDCVFTDQKESDFTEAIRSNYIHSLRGRVCV